jgi:hypothetical protein
MSLRARILYGTAYFGLSAAIVLSAFTQGEFPALTISLFVLGFGLYCAYRGLWRRAASSAGRGAPSIFERFAWMLAGVPAAGAVALSGSPVAGWVCVGAMALLGVALLVTERQSRAS